MSQDATEYKRKERERQVQRGRKIDARVRSWESLGEDIPVSPRAEGIDVRKQMIEEIYSRSPNIYVFMPIRLVRHRNRLSLIEVK